MSKAKTASKNAPSNRGAVKEYFYNGKKISPIKYIGLSSQYMAAADEQGNLIYANSNDEDPITWAEAAGE